MPSGQTKYRGRPGPAGNRSVRGSAAPGSVAGPPSAATDNIFAHPPGVPPDARSSPSPARPRAHVGLPWQIRVPATGARRAIVVRAEVAERVGFEPTIRCYPYDDLANRCLDR